MQRLYIADYSNRAVRIIEGTAAPTLNPTTVSPTYTTSPTLSPSSRGAAFENSVSNVTTLIPFVESGYPRWVAIGENINTMYITTTANKIFRVNIFNKTQTLVAGISNNGGTDGTTNIARFNDLGALTSTITTRRAFSYMSPIETHKIRRVDVNQGTVDTVAGADLMGASTGCTCRHVSTIP